MPAGCPISVLVATNLQLHLGNEPVRGLSPYPARQFQHRPAQRARRSVSGWRVLTSTIPQPVPVDPAAQRKLALQRGATAQQPCSALQYHKGISPEDRDKALVEQISPISLPSRSSTSGIDTGKSNNDSA
jgi:hypothetical protein